MSVTLMKGDPSSAVGALNEVLHTSEGRQAHQKQQPDQRRTLHSQAINTPIPIPNNKLSPNRAAANSAPRMLPA